MTRCIIMAAGTGERWGQDKPKHLAAPTGEPLLTRLCRQLGERGQDDIIVMGPQEYRVHVPGHVRVITPVTLGDSPEWLGATKFANTTGYWSHIERTVVFYGDCWLDDAVVDAILDNQERALLVWCRFGASKQTGCRWGENFAFSFYPEHRVPFLDAIRATVQAHRDGVINRSGGWEIARAWSGAHGPAIAKHKRYPCYRDVGHLGTGFSDDFDTPKDLERWLQRWAAQ